MSATDVRMLRITKEYILSFLGGGNFKSIDCEIAGGRANCRFVRGMKFRHGKMLEWNSRLVYLDVGRISDLARLAGYRDFVPKKK